MVALPARLLMLMGLTLTLGLSHTARAQEPVTISGRVVDAATNQRLPSVNVYLAHTLRGAAADVEGRYTIVNVPPGSYELVASMLGYATETMQIEVMPGAPEKTINFRLAPLVYELDAVEVTAKRSRRWKYSFDQFEDLFLGTSDHAKQTEIINPYVLSFEVARLTRVLTATASAPLEIENRALGYRLRFVLRQFRWDPNNEQLTLLGLPHFETLEPEDDQQARQWEENREEAFQGSLPHLFRAMIAGRTFEEGFQLQLQQPTFARPVTADDLLRKRDGAYLYELSFNGELHVSYQGSTGRGGFLRRKSLKLDYWIYLSTYLGFVSEDGHVSPPRVLSTSHYPKRIADLLPREYGLEPEPQQAAGETEVDLMPLAHTHMVEDERRAGQPRQEKTEAMQQALAAMRASRWNTAGRALDRILKDDPDDEEAHYYRAICAREIARVHPFHDEEYRAVKDYRDKWTKAIDRFEGILRRDSLYRDVVYQYALLWRDALKYERAIKLGHAQVRLRPELEHAHHGLFQLYRAYLNNSNKKRVAQRLAQQPGGYAAYFRGEALRKAGALPEAEAIFQRLLSDGSSMPKQPVLLSLARIDYAKEQPQQAQAYVAQAMEGIENSLEAMLVFDDVKYLVSEKELDAYQALNEPTAYRSYFQAFWARRDPTPAGPINVRLAEHYRRLLVAERDYGYAGLRMWHTNPDKVGDLDFPPAYALNEEFNDKGLIYIRYGEPDNMISAVDGNMEARTAVDTGQLGGEVNRALDLLWVPIEKSFQQEWKPNESWRYHHPRLDVHFVLEGGGSNWRLTPLLPLELGILQNREHWGGTYAEMVREARAFAQLRAEADASALAPDPNIFLRSLALESIADRMAEDSRKAVSLALTTDRHTWPEEIEPLDVPFLAAAFRGADGQTRLEIHYALPIGRITQRTPTDTDSLQVEFGIALHDTTWRSLVEHAQTLLFPTNEDPQHAITGSLTLSVPPDTYHVALHARPLHSHLLAAYQFEKRLPAFTRSDLMISDLLLAYHVQSHADVPSPKRSDVQIVPNPYQRFATNEPVHVYFELYNLTYGADDRTHYTLEYTLRPLKKGKAPGVLERGRDEVTLSLKTEREGQETSPIEYTEIDVSRVPAGRYELSVTVTDQQTGRSARQAIPVELYKP